MADPFGGLLRSVLIGIHSFRTIAAQPLTAAHALRDLLQASAVADSPPY